MCVVSLHVYWSKKRNDETSQQQLTTLLEVGRHAWRRSGQARKRRSANACASHNGLWASQSMYAQCVASSAEQDICGKDSASITFTVCLSNGRCACERPMSSSCLEITGYSSCGAYCFKVRIERCLGLLLRSLSGLKKLTFFAFSLSTSSCLLLGLTCQFRLSYLSFLENGWSMSRYCLCCHSLARTWRSDCKQEAVNTWRQWYRTEHSHKKAFAVGFLAWTDLKYQT